MFSKTVEQTVVVVKRFCECKCGGYANPGKRFIKQHHRRGKAPWNKGKTCIYSAVVIAKFSAAKKGKPNLKVRGENNYGWKGENVKRAALHVWVRSRLPEPVLCEYCNKVPPKDLANITGIYSIDLTNWKYLCRKCHFTLDKGVDMTGRTCSVCGNDKTYINRKTGRPRWCGNKNGNLCMKCYQATYYRLRPGYTDRYYLRKKIFSTFTKRPILVPKRILEHLPSIYKRSK